MFGHPVRDETRHLLLELATVVVFRAQGARVPAHWVAPSGVNPHVRQEFAVFVGTIGGLYAERSLTKPIR